MKRKLLLVSATQPRRLGAIIDFDYALFWILNLGKQTIKSTGKRKERTSREAREAEREIRLLISQCSME